MTIEPLEEMKLKLNSVSPSFCLAKWFQVTLHLYKGTTQSCHHVATTPITDADLAQGPSGLHNTEQKARVRAQMLRGEFPKECQYCWKIEKIGQYSDRIHKSAAGWAKPFLETAKASASAHVVPKYLEVAFENTCNFKCSYCSPAYSSLWEQESLRYGGYPTSGQFNDIERVKREQGEWFGAERSAKYVDAFWKWWPEIAHEVRHLRVTGGEPLLSKDTWRLMDHLIEHPRPQLYFSINSNLSMSAAAMDRFVDKLAALEEKTAGCLLFCSIDSVGAQAEYIRHGLDFDRFIAHTYRILRETPATVQLSYMITTNALSLPGLAGLLELIAKQRREFPERRINVDTPLLTSPEFLSVEILPRRFVRHLMSAIRVMRENGFSAAEIQRIERIANLMLSDSLTFRKKRLLRHDFVKFIAEHDRRRKTDALETFPEYRAFIRTCRWLMGFYFSAQSSESSRA